MIKKLLSPGLTPMLMKVLSDPLSPKPDTVRMLLNSGAGPWAVAQSTHADIPGRSMFYLICLRAPHEECLDAWFKRTGTIVGEPWHRHRTPNPFHEMMEGGPQPYTFMAQLAGRLFQSGLVPTAPEGQRLGTWLHHHCGDGFPAMLRTIAQHYPQAVLDLSNWDDAQRAEPAFERAFRQAAELASSSNAATLEKASESIACAPSGPRRRI